MITEEELSEPDKAVEKCQWFLEERSKTAERYVGRYLRIADPGASIHDVSINEFLIERGLKAIPDNIEGINKTPDVLMKIGSLIVMGDVAVSRSPEDIAIRKELKYRMIMESIRIYNKDIMVSFESFIFKDDGSNIEEVQTKIKSIVERVNPLFKWEMSDYELRLKEDLITWNNRLLYVSKNVKDKNAFIYKYQMLEAEAEDDILLGSMRIPNQYDPKVTEEEIALSIFDEIERKSTIKRTKDIDLQSIKNQINAKRDADYDRMEPKHCIPYLFNSGDDSSLMDIDLLNDYRNDLSSIGSNLISLLPTGNTISSMKQVKNEYDNIKVNPVNKNRKEFRDHLKVKYNRTTPYYCNINELNRFPDPEMNIVDWYINKMTQINEKEKPKSVKSEDFETCKRSIDELIKCMNLESKSTSTNIEFDKPDRGDRVNREERLIEEIKPHFDKMNKTIACCLLSCVRKFVNDVAHMPTILKKGIYYSIPIQKNTIILIFTGTNLTKRNPSIYFTTLTRLEKSDKRDMDLLDVQGRHARYKEETTRFVYLLDKLHKYDMARLAKLVNVDREFRVHYMSMQLMSDLSDEDSEKYLSKYTGLIALCLLDLHQKPSDMLDLMKYLVAMPMSTHSSLDELLKDKLSIMLKTDLDVFLYNNIFDFLSKNIELQHTRKTNELIVQKNGYILPESFNISGKFAMFCETSVITDSLLFYISESQLIFHTRPKKLYSSQFIDKCAFKVADYNDRMETEETKHKGWTKEGYNITNKDMFNYPYEADFCYSRDAMYYAQLDEDAELARFAVSTLRSSNKKTAELFPNNLSMRGACIIPGSNLDNSREVERKLRNFKEREKELLKLNKTKREKPIDELFKIRRSTTALLSGLTMMDKVIRDNDTERSRVGNILREHKDDHMYFNMSEKEQRGGGRPIGSADFFTKQRLYCIEKMYQKIGERQPDNLMARSVNRSAKLSDVSRNMIQEAVKTNRKYLSYIVMDQSQFSESDNMNKFLSNISDNRCIPVNIKEDMIDSLSKMIGRTQFFPKIPSEVKDKFPQYLTKDKGIKGNAGWVQGMLNISSTHIHIIAVKWITKLFNKYYNKYYSTESTDVKVEHLVNSDDSFAIICSDDPEKIKRYYEYLLNGKRLFCLKQNKKKSYISSIIGEVIQKYVANGSTINIWAKDAVAVFNSMRGLDMYKDISTALGTLQTISRNGAPEIACCYVRAECKNKILNIYNVNKGKVNDISSLGLDIGKLPVELLGWPKYISTYELTVAGAFAQSTYCYNEYERSKREDGQWNTREGFVVLAAIALNMASGVEKNNVELFEQDQEQPQEKVIIEIKKIKQLLEADDLDAYEEQRVEIEEREDKHREKSMISFKTLGLDIASGNFAKSLINPFTFCHPFSIKVTDTIKKLRSYIGEESGLAGLINIRTSILTSVIDIRENMSSMLMALSEMGFNNDFRGLAASSSIVASSRSVILPGSKRRHTIRQCFKILLDVSFKLEGKSILKQAVDNVSTIMRDPSHRSEMADEIMLNMLETGVITPRPTVVTLMPELESDLGLVNPLQLVLAEIVKPGILVREGYVLNHPDQLNSDISIINSKFGDWLQLAKDKLPIACSIYYHYLNYRRGRYIVGPPMERGDMMSFLISWYKTKFSDKYTITANYTGKDANRTIEFKDNVPNLMCSVAELYFKCCIIGNLVDKTVFIQGMHVTIRGTEYTIEQFCQNEISDVILNECSTATRPILAAMVFDITGRDTHLRKFIKSETTRAEWIKEQVKDFNPYSKRVTWTGKFVVDIIKGDTAIRVSGEPGNMEMLYCNKKNMRMIMELLFFLRRNNRFDNYEIKRDAKGIFNDGFFSTRNEMVISSVDEAIDPMGKYPVFRKNPIKEGKDMSYFTNKQLIPCTIVDDSFFNFSREDNEEYNRFSIDLDKVPQLSGHNKVYMYETDKVTGQVNYVEKDNKVRLTRLDINFQAFNTNGLSAKGIMIAGIDAKTLIMDEEIKNIVRTNITGVTKTHLEKYIKDQIPRVSLIESLGYNLLNYYLNTGEKKIEILNELKIVDLDVEIDKLVFDQEILETDVVEDSLTVINIPDREGNILSKMIETYSCRYSGGSNLMDLVRAVKSTQVKDAIKECNPLFEKNWADEEESVENFVSLLVFKMEDDYSNTKTIYENVDDDEERPFVADDSYIFGRSDSEIDAIFESSKSAYDMLLTNKLYNYSNFKKLMDSTEETKVNRRNKYMPFIRNLIHNLDSAKKDLSDEQ